MRERVVEDDTVRVAELMLRWNPDLPDSRSLLIVAHKATFERLVDPLVFSRIRLYGNLYPGFTTESAKAREIRFFFE